MIDKDTLIGSGALAVIADGLLNSFDLLLGSVDLLFGNVDLLYLIVLVLNRMAGGVSWLDQGSISDLMIAIAVVYLVHLSLKLTRRLKLKQRLTNDS